MFVLGLTTPLVDNTAYSATCTCFNGASLSLSVDSNVILVDFTPPVCNFVVVRRLTDSLAPLGVSWTCSDAVSGVNTPLYWAIGTAPGATDYSPFQATNLVSGSISQVRDGEGERGSGACVVDWQCVALVVGICSGSSVCISGRWGRRQQYGCR